MSRRLDLRLDDERRSHLEEIAHARGEAISEVVRQLIDDAYEIIDRDRRLRAVERMAALSFPVPEEPDELSRILSDAHDPGQLY